VSVDTYLKGKNTSKYHRYREGGVDVLVAPSLVRWAQWVDLDVRTFLLWKSWEIEVEHRHGPT
jgi:hypothetical protein